MPRSDRTDWTKPRYLALPAAFLAAAVGLYLLALELPGGGGPDGGAAASPWRDQVRLAAAAGIWLGAAWLAKRLLSALILSYADRTARRGGPSLLVGGGSQLLIDLGGAVVFAAALLGVVALVYHLPLGGLLATSGVVAAIVGFAIQRMIADVFSGLALNVEHPFAVGDWIETASGVTGKVLDANWRAVHLETIEGRAVVVPNSLLANNQFINLNAPRRPFRLKKTICLDYSVPAERVVPIFQAAMEATDGVLAEPRSIVLIDECNERGVVYSLNFWAPDYPDSFPISRQVVVNALRFLDQAGLAPAYPKRDVTISEAAVRQLESGIDVPTVLARVPLLRHLGREAIRALEHGARLHDQPDGRVVIREGDPGGSLFVVIAGLLEASRRDGSGRPRAVGRLSPGDVFGEISLLTGAPRMATVTTLTPATLIEIDERQLRPILDRHPEVIDRLSDIEAARLLANRDALHLEPEEQATIERVGKAVFLRQRILQFLRRERDG